MAGIGKCMGIVTGAGMLSGAAASYLMQNKINKVLVNNATAQAKDGYIPIGGMTKDGKLWDGRITVEDYKKGLQKKALITSLINGAVTALTTAVIAGATLLLRGKIK